MEEAQRFLRYVIPGLTLIIELLAYLLISGNISPDDILRHSKELGIAGSVLIASGGLGFLLGVNYYTVVWREIILKKILWGADLRPVLRIAESKGWLKLYYTNGNEVKVDNLKKREAWQILTHYWITKAEDSISIKGAVRRVDRLADLMNGLGTACVASFWALTGFLIINISIGFRGQFSLEAFGSFILGIFILIVHHVNYKGVIKDYEKIVNMTILKKFEIENEGNKVVKVYIFEEEKCWIKSLKKIPDKIKSLIKCLFEDRGCLCRLWSKVKAWRRKGQRTDAAGCQRSHSTFSAHYSGNER